MNVDRLRHKLIAVGRAAAPSPAVPYSFETRIMARLGRAVLPDPWVFWNQILWRAAAPCVAIMLVTGAWSWVAEQSHSTPETLAADLEATICAPLAAGEEAW